MTADELRERIEAALRGRYATDNVSVLLGPAPDGFSGYDAAVPVIGGYVAARADDEATALRGLARIVGLDADGTDHAYPVDWYGSRAPMRQEPCVLRTCRTDP